jgi:acyl dehydratase
MAFTSVAVISEACPSDPSRLSRLAVRFAKPVQPGQTITTSLWPVSGGAFAYETTSAALPGSASEPVVGAVVIKDGLAEIRS